MYFNSIRLDLIKMPTNKIVFYIVIFVLLVFHRFIKFRGRVILNVCNIKKILAMVI